jgi:hypothetical protein
MTTNRSSAGRATPFFFLGSEKFLHSICCDGAEILQKTHPEKLLISGINGTKVLTGKLRAF